MNLDLNIAFIAAGILGIAGCVALELSHRRYLREARRRMADADREFADALARLRGEHNLDAPRNRTPGGWP